MSAPPEQQTETLPKTLNQNSRRPLGTPFAISTQNLLRWRVPDTVPSDFLENYKE
jgi:hypothetical protein